MNTTLWPTSDNATEVPLYNRSDDIPTIASRTRRQFGLNQQLTYTIGTAAAVIGMCANAMVIGVLVTARRRFGSNVNTFIVNQAVMDLCACILFGITATIFITCPTASPAPNLSILSHNEQMAGGCPPIKYCLYTDGVAWTSHTVRHPSSLALRRVST